MRLVLAIAALAAFLVAMFGSAQAPAAAPVAPRAETGVAAAIVAPSSASLLAPAVAGRVSDPTSAPVAQLHAVESSVHAARLRGAGENEIHQLRAGRLTAAQLESLLAMESAEVRWRQQVSDLRRRCGSNEACASHLAPEERARWRSYASPALRH